MTIFKPTRMARAPYASDPYNARGRIIEQPTASERSPFQRDKDRIIHSSAFRRLKGKTQVFVAHEGDYYRTRLTHSIEVSQIARSIARVLGLDEDLAECLALAHDLGHPPFGHAGEDALSKAMAAYGGFDHNAQTLRIVTKLESRYAEFDGLNLTWETLEGIAKHNGPVVEREEDYRTLPWALRAIPDYQALELHTYAGPEAQVAAISDDIAYINHDIDDGLRAGLFTVEDIMDVPFVGEAFADVRSRYPNVSEDRQIHEAVRDMIGIMVADVLAETRRRLERHNPQTPDDIRHMPEAVCDFSEGFREKERPLRQFLITRMYKHYLVNRMMSQASRVVGELFGLFIAEPSVLPTDVQRGTAGPHAPETARVVSDYIASMTDNFAIAEHRKLFTATGYLGG
ncbi:MAG: deoxyguanosinetriphosphate triphosphohydrolase [Litorimonas sp.]